MLDDVVVFDIEGDGLIPTKIHVMSWCENGKIKSTTDYDEMRSLFRRWKTIAGHNIICFDIPVIERILGIKIECRVIDTLTLSWYLYYTRPRHGLESWGITYGYPKVPIDDWHNLSIEEYTERCERDVEINVLLWKDQWSYLQDLYIYDKDASRLIRYLMFKQDCVAEAERSRWKLDVKLARSSKASLLWEMRGKVKALKAAMPSVKKKAWKERPAKPFKKDGTWSVNGAKWFNLVMQTHGLTIEEAESWNEPIEVVVRLEEPNPNSPVQIKDWLYSLGWVPETFEYKKDNDPQVRELRKIPQIQIKGEGRVCDSVLKLADKEPAILVLNGLSVAKHRAGIFKGFLRDNQHGYLQARMNGFTNTLRLKHAEIVNLPGVGKPWGKEVRGCLIANEGYELLGSDLSSLEDFTKRHYMFDFDPDFVNEMAKPGFDPHLDLALQGNAIDKVVANILWEQRLFNIGKPEDERIDEHSIDGKSYKAIRHNFKGANYACTYGVQAQTLARQTGISVPEAQKLIDAYWKRNWALEAFTKTLKTKTVNKQKWVYNPVSEFWYPLKNDKDKFSTINQSTGVFVFDSWIREIRTIRGQFTGQFHDEIILEVKKGHREVAEKTVRDALARVNKKLKLNVVIGCDVQFGDNYGEIH